MKKFIILVSLITLPLSACVIAKQKPNGAEATRPATDPISDTKQTHRNTCYGSGRDPEKCDRDRPPEKD